MFRLAVADLDSPSYFVATAAVELASSRTKESTSSLSSPMARSTDRNGCAAARCISWAVRPIWRHAPFRAGGARVCCAPWRNIPTGFWRCAPTLTSSVATCRAEGFADFLVDGVSGARVAPPFGGCRHRSGARRARIVPPPRRRWAFHGPRRRRGHRDNLADAFWGNGMRVALGENAASPSSTSICAAAMGRRALAGITSPR